MIQANELRIGNLISLQGKEVTVNLNTLERLLYPELKKHSKFLGHYKPVSITEERLLTMGFVDEYTTDGFLASRFHDFWFMNSGQIRMLYGGYILLDKEVKYVHQLQNLYFALTGVEL